MSDCRLAAVPPANVQASRNIHSVCSNDTFNVIASEFVYSRLCAMNSVCRSAQYKPATFFMTDVPASWPVWF